MKAERVKGEQKMNTERCVKLDSVYKKIFVGVPMTPGNWVSKTAEYVPVTRLCMSCGGGMGGSKWYEYVNRIPLDELSEKKTIVATTWDGKRKLINMDYVVKAEEFTIMKAVYISMNPNFPTGEYLVARLVEDGAKVSLINEFQRED